MAILSLQSAASALTALNTSMDVIANNLANVNTAGFKASRANFQDLLYIEKAQPGVETASGDQRPIGLYVGLGTKIAGTQVDFTEGSPITTNRPLDLLISGNGFFQVQVPDGLSSDRIAYTRAGQFTKNKDGDLVLATDTGRRLVPTINIPDNATGVSVGPDGRVFYTTPGSTTPQLAGTIETAVFVNPQGLKSVGENLFVVTDASGPAITGQPGSDNRGELRAGMYEASNVDPTRELIELIRVQRAFEMNSNTIRAADETLRTVAQLRR
jgi:flagellar basal-body rod protein FlgG